MSVVEFEPLIAGGGSERRSDEDHAGSNEANADCRLSEALAQGGDSQRASEPQRTD